MSKVFVTESEEQQNYLERQEHLREQEELLKILEKKIQYLKDDPAAESIPGNKRIEMISRFEKESAEVRRLLDEMLADRQGM